MSSHCNYPLHPYSQILTWWQTLRRRCSLCSVVGWYGTETMAISRYSTLSLCILPTAEFLKRKTLFKICCIVLSLASRTNARASQIKFFRPLHTGDVINETIRKLFTVSDVNLGYYATICNNPIWICEYIITLKWYLPKT